MSTPLHRFAGWSALALVVGVVATAVMTYVPIERVDRGRGGRIQQIYRGEYAWIHARDEAFGLEWSNLQLTPTRMTTPLVDGTLPAWAEPPPPPYPDVQFLRIGTLAAGWPFHTVAFRWTVTTTKRNFPMHAELDDGDTSISHAAESVLHGDRGGPPEERRLLWGGILANIAISSGIALATLLMIGRLRDRRRVQEAR